MCLLPIRSLSPISPSPTLPLVAPAVIRLARLHPIRPPYNQAKFLAPLLLVSLLPPWATGGECKGRLPHLQLALLTSPLFHLDTHRPYLRPVLLPPCPSLPLRLYRTTTLLPLALPQEPIIILLILHHGPTTRRPPTQLITSLLTNPPHFIPCPAPTASHHTLNIQLPPHQLKTIIDLTLNRAALSTPLLRLNLFSLLHLLPGTGKRRTRPHISILPLVIPHRHPSRTILIKQTMKCHISHLFIILPRISTHRNLSALQLIRALTLVAQRPLTGAPDTSRFLLRRPRCPLTIDPLEAIMTVRPNLCSMARSPSF